MRRCKWVEELNHSQHVFDVKELFLFSKKFYRSVPMIYSSCFVLPSEQTDAGKDEDGSVWKWYKGQLWMVVRIILVMIMAVMMLMVMMAMMMKIMMTLKNYDDWCWGRRDGGDDGFREWNVHWLATYFDWPSWRHIVGRIHHAVYKIDKFWIKAASSVTNIKWVLHRLSRCD